MAHLDEAKTEDGKKSNSSGKVINLFSGDINTIVWFLNSMEIITEPITSTCLSLIIAVISVIYLYKLVGTSALIGVGIMTLLTIFAFFLGKKMRTMYVRVSKDNDARVSSVNEVIFLSYKRC